MINMKINVFLAFFISFGLFLLFNCENNINTETYYTVTLNANGGVVSQNQIKVKKDTRLGYIPQPTKTSNKFNGWYNDFTEDGIEYNSSSIISSDIILYAKWIEGYSVTLNPNGGSVYPNSVFVEKGKPVSNLPKAVRDSYFFYGWYFNNEPFIDNTVLYSDITLVANWRSYPKTWGIKAIIQNTTVIYTFTMGEGDDNILKELEIYLGWMGGPQHNVKVSELTKELNINDGSYSASYFEANMKYKYTGTLEYTGSDKRYFCLNFIYFDGTRTFSAWTLSLDKY